MAITFVLIIRSNLNFNLICILWYSIPIKSLKKKRSSYFLKVLIRKPLGDEQTEGQTRQFSEDITYNASLLGVSGYKNQKCSQIYPERTKKRVNGSLSFCVTFPFLFGWKQTILEQTHFSNFFVPTSYQQNRIEISSD